MIKEIASSSSRTNNIPTRSQRAAQLLVGSMTEIILLMNRTAIQNSKYNKLENHCMHQIFAGKIKIWKLKEKQNKPSKIGGCAVNNTFVIVLHLKERAILTPGFSKLQKSKEDKIMLLYVGLFSG